MRSKRGRASVERMQGDIVEPGQATPECAIRFEWRLAVVCRRGRRVVVDLRDQIAALDVRRLRLEAELAGQFDFTVPADLGARAADMIASERALLKARQEDFVKRSEGTKGVLKQSAEEERLLENLRERKIVALIEVTRARKAHADAQKRFDEVITQAELERAEAYSETLKELATLRQGLKSS